VDKLQWKTVSDQPFLVKNRVFSCRLDRKDTRPATVYPSAQPQF